MNTQQLTFTRFIAAVSIVFFHYGKDILVTDINFINVIRVNLSLGVSYFYVLSGFVMILAYGNDNKVNFKKYITNRLARLYPLHIFTLVLTIFVSLLVALHYLKYFRLDKTALFFNVTLLQAWMPNYSLWFNFPSWSISVELFFYLIFPFIFNKIYKNLNLKYFALFILGFWCISQFGVNVFYFLFVKNITNSFNFHFLYYNPFLHLNSFLIGILCARIFKHYKTIFNKNFDKLIIIIILLTIVLIYLFRNLFIHDGFLSLNFGIIILLIAANRGKMTDIFSKKSFIHLGNISFAIYLLQIPIFTFIEKVFKTLHIFNSNLLFVTGFSILMICSHFTYTYIEIPCQIKIRKYFKKVK